MIRGWEETFGGDGYIYGLDCGSGFMEVYWNLQTHRVVYIKSAQFLDVNHAPRKWFKNVFKEEIISKWDCQSWHPDLQKWLSGT